MPKLVKFACVALLGVQNLLQATTLEQLSLDEIIQKSTGILRAKVLSSYTALRGTDMYTFYRLEVSEGWKGTRVAEVAVPGGVLGGVRQTVAGAPYLTPGEDYVLFLWTGKSGLTQVIGMSQGVFTVKVDASGNVLVSRGAIAEAMVDSAGRPVQNSSISLRLSEMRMRIQTQSTGEAR